MLAMCGEQSLTVSSFSICRDSVSQKAAYHQQLTNTLALQSSAARWLSLRVTDLWWLVALWSCCYKATFPSTSG